MRTPLKDLRAELSTAELGDARLTKRLGTIANRCLATPGVGLPQAMEDQAALEAAYRFFGNDGVSPEAVLEPHAQATAGRCRARDLIYLVSDTTEFCFPGDPRDGLGPLQGRRQGFLGHFCLAVGGGELRRVLGVLGSETWARPHERRERGKEDYRTDPHRESLRWRRVAERSQAGIADLGSVLHVLDAEADIYDLLAWFADAGIRFVVRVARNRRTASSEPEFANLFEALSNAPSLLDQDVPISERKRAVKGHPARATRRARLSYAAAEVSIRRPRRATKSWPDELRLNFVHISEPSPPEGEEPIDWKLVTSEPVATADDITAVTTAYRARWVIEEFFKALKTGCGFEKAQLETFDGLRNYLAVLTPVAWQLLELRGVARDQPGAAATTVLSPLQIQVLRAVARRPMSTQPTIEEVILAIAGLGGHIRNNGPPGWQVLGRGFLDLARYVQGWQAAREATEM